MSLKDNISIFTKLVNEYRIHKLKSTIDELDTVLKILVNQIDENLYDENSMFIAHFIGAIYDIIVKIGEFSKTGWHCVDILRTLCRNEVAKTNLMNTYVFISPLASLLKTATTEELKINLLTLLEQLSYGINLPYQPANLSYLLTTLSEWITNSSTKTIADLSLSVLVNICYKKPEACYTFITSVNTKQLMRYCIQQVAPRNNVNIFKLLLIIDNGRNRIPLQFQRECSLSTVFESFQNENVDDFRDRVDLFLDFHNGSDEMLKEFKSKSFDFENTFLKHLGKFHPHTTPIPHTLLTPLFHLFHHLTPLNLPSLTPHHGTLISLLLPWWTSHPQTTTTSLAAICLTRSLVTAIVNKGDGDMAAQLLAGLLAQLPECVEGMVTGGWEEGEGERGMQHDMATEVVKLVRGLLQMEGEVRKRVVQLFNSIDINQLFPSLPTAATATCADSHMDHTPPLSSTNNGLSSSNPTSSSSYAHSYAHTLSTAIKTRHTETVALLVELAHYHTDWTQRVVQLLKYNHPLQGVLAWGLLSGGVEVREVVLGVLVSGYVPVGKMVAALEELKSLPRVITDNSSSKVALLNNPLVPTYDENNLRNIIAKLEEKLSSTSTSSSNCPDSYLSSLISLYTIKIKSLEQSESVSQFRLDQQATLLDQDRQQLALLSSELQELHGLLHRQVQRSADMAVMRETVEQRNVVLGEELQRERGSFSTLSEKMKGALGEMEKLKQTLGQAKEDKERQQKHADFLKKKMDQVVNAKDSAIQSLETEVQKQSKSIESQLAQMKENELELTKTNLALVQKSSIISEYQRKNDSIQKKLDLLEARMESVQNLISNR